MFEPSVFGVITEELEFDCVLFMDSAYTNWRKTGDTEIGVTAAEETRITIKQKDKILFLFEIFSL